MSQPSEAREVDTESSGPPAARPSRRRRTALAGALVVLVVIAAAAVVVTRPSTSTPHAHGRRTAPAVSSAPDVTASSAVGSTVVPAGFPSAGDTGVPAGTSLRVMAGDLVVRTPGEVLSDVLIDGCLTVAVAGVTVRDSKIVCDSSRTALSLTGAARDTTLTDVEIDGSGVSPVGLAGKGFTASGLNIYGSGDGVHLGSGSVLRASYIHDLAHQPLLHHDDLQIPKGATVDDITIEHNTLLDVSAVSNGNSVFHVGTAVIDGLSVTDNFMDGGTFCIQIDGGDAQRGVDFTGNHFGRHYRYGLITITRSGGTDISFAGNTWQDDGQPATEQNSRRPTPGAGGSPSG